MLEASKNTAVSSRVFSVMVIPVIAVNAQRVEGYAGRTALNLK